MKESTDNIKKYAAHWVLVLSGSIVVLSVALNQVGFRVDRVLDAWSQAIVLESKAKYELQNCPVSVDLSTDKLYLLEELSQRLEILESMAHPRGNKS